MYLILTKVDIKIKRGFNQTYEKNKICRKLIKNLKSTEACRIVGLQIQGVGAYAPFHNLPLMKFKIIYFCP